MAGWIHCPALTAAPSGGPIASKRHTREGLPFVTARECEGLLALRTRAANTALCRVVGNRPGGGDEAHGGVDAGSRVGKLGKNRGVPGGRNHQVLP